MYTLLRIDRDMELMLASRFVYRGQLPDRRNYNAARNFSTLPSKWFTEILHFLIILFPNLLRFSRSKMDRIRQWK